MNFSIDAYGNIVFYSKFYFPICFGKFPLWTYL